MLWLQTNFTRNREGYVMKEKKNQSIYIQLQISLFPLFSNSVSFVFMKVSSESFFVVVVVSMLPAKIGTHNSFTLPLESL